MTAGNRARRLAAVVMLMGWTAALAASAAPKTTPSPKTGAAPRGGTMPDTALAWIGKQRDVTVSEFHAAWKQVQPPARPDTLTPQTAREFLDLLIDKEILAEKAGAESWVWAPVESAQYIGLRDQLMLKAALDSSLKDIRSRREAAGDSALDDQALGIAARESTTARMAIRYDEGLVTRLTMAWAAIPKPPRDSSLWVQLRVLGAMPQVEPADSVRTVAESVEGPYRVLDLLESWKRTNPLSRPRIETSAQMKDLIKNGLYERALRRAAEVRRLDQRPDIAAQLAQRREYVAVSHLVEREVYHAMKMDSVTLRAWYSEHRDEYNLPDRVQVVRMELPDRASASAMAVRLRDPIEAESLAAKALRSGLNYRAEISAESDSVLFESAMKLGAGAVVGPDSAQGGWQVARVEAIRPARQRTYEEAQELVAHHYYNELGERKMRELIDDLRKRTPLRVNDHAVGKLASP